jgi:hypothetical protein
MEYNQTKMASPIADLMSNIFSSDRQARAVAANRGIIALRVRGEAAEPFAARGPKRRTTIWEMHQSVHCSIIGTCLSSAELRRLMLKRGIEGAATADDHTLHKQGVALASRPQGGAKFIQKALDRRHEMAIKQCARLKDEAALTGYWEDALRRGDIPGAYWAVLSHPAAGDALMRLAFGDVHMLSHMVGAANRADIRRLRQLENENAAFAAKLESQQRQLRDGFVARDEKIRALNEALSRALSQTPPSVAHSNDDTEIAKDALVELGRRVSRETARGKRLEERLVSMASNLANAEHRAEQAEHENRYLRSELALVEAQVSAWLKSDGTMEAGSATDAAPSLMLGGMALLYVGGRTHQVPQLKAVVERAGGVFLYHDGGIEHAPTLLPGLVSRAGCLAFPIDCVSHEAVAMVKRLCRQSNKPFLPLRTSSVASLLSGLAKLREAKTDPASA